MCTNAEIWLYGRAEHTVAITPEDVISWGGNSYGQCGQGERAEVTSVKPRSIKPLQGISIAQVVCGRYHTLCVTATSQVCTLPADIPLHCSELLQSQSSAVLLLP